jgi:Transposase DDE domain group 1
LLCFVGETGEWLHAKLRHGHAAASTGATRFLGECLRRLPGVRLFLRADEGFYGKDFLAELEQRQITYTVGAQLNRALRERIAAVADDGWERSSYRHDSEVASFVWKPKTWKQARRFVVRRDPVEQGEQLALDEGEWHYWALVTNDEERSADELEIWHRAKARVENRIKEAKLGFALDNLPSRLFHANWAYLLCTLLAYNLLCWLKLLALPASERGSYAKRLRFRYLNIAATVGRCGRPSCSASPRATRSSPTSSARSNASARSHARPPERLAHRQPESNRRCPGAAIAQTEHVAINSPTRRVETTTEPVTSTVGSKKAPPKGTSAPYRRIRVAKSHALHGCLP